MKVFTSMQNSFFQDIPTDAAISEIAPLPSDPNLRRVRVGRKTVATLRAADIESLGLHVGGRWTVPLAKTVQAEVAANKARKTAMQLLGRRAYSHHELIERLLKKRHEKPIAQRIADEMAANHWLNDEAYGQAVVHEISRKGSVGPRLLSAKLQARKIEPALADRIARQAVAEVDLLDAAVDLARRRFKAMGSLPAATARRRIAGMLARRGFDDELIAAALDRLRISDTEPPTEG